MRVVSWAVGNVLPAGTTWGGVVPVEYVEDTASYSHAAACPPPEPRP